MAKTSKPHCVSGEKKIELGQSFAPIEDIICALDLLEGSLGYEKRPAEEFKQVEPMDGLMLILLSQNTNDRNRDIAFAKLKKLYPRWEEVAKRSAEEIEPIIRLAGLGKTKSQRMIEILSIIQERLGGYSIDPLLEWNPEEVREFLGSLPGIGPKTVACVMVFDLDMPAFPVDTHVHRISHKLGWVPRKYGAIKAQEYLEGVLPPDRFRGAHLNVIEHGRQVCHARKPKCESCCVRALCKWIVEPWS